MKHLLEIREVDRKVFEALKDGSKIVETRAATPKYQKINIGDILVFVCGQDRLEREVEKVKRYKSVDEMVKEIDFKEIAPFVSTIADLKKMYVSFPNYEEKIAIYGLIACFLNSND